MALYKGDGPNNRTSCLQCLATVGIANRAVLFKRHTREGTSQKTLREDTNSWQQVLSVHVMLPLTKRTPILNVENGLAEG